METRQAAQYIRMSTDRQDLSPALQKEAIAAYAAARGYDIVASYEDEGRSGVHLKNRPALLRLLKEVTESKRFTIVLVYDVSRWGRFQDTDAAAYYEYHCRLHGAEVVYVAEMFGAEVNPITAMLKSMKRAMAAEYSRDLSAKARAGQHQVIARGFQIGSLPPLGYRRCSVSADGSRRALLEHRQRKLAATDRVEWVLAPAAEVELVRRICDLYARRGFSVADIARLGRSEGWRTGTDHPVSAAGVASLLSNEALIGNFVWGRKKRARTIVPSPPSRHDECVPRIIDDETWALIQERGNVDRKAKLSDGQVEAQLVRVLQQHPMLVGREFRAHGLPAFQAVRRRLGNWRDKLKDLHLDPVEINRAISARGQARRNAVFEFGIAFAFKLRDQGVRVVYDGHLRLFQFPGLLTVRPQFLWPTQVVQGLAWTVRINKCLQAPDFALVVRIGADGAPQDYILVPPADFTFRFPRCLNARLPEGLERYQCISEKDLIGRLLNLCAQAESSEVRTE